MKLLDLNLNSKISIGHPAVHRRLCCGLMRVFQSLVSLECNRYQGSTDIIYEKSSSMSVLLMLVNIWHFVSKLMKMYEIWRLQPYIVVWFMPPKFILLGPSSDGTISRSPGETSPREMQRAGGLNRCLHSQGCNQP